MEYNSSKIEAKWKKFWEENNTYRVEIDKSKPKFYILDMFPYPSGAGLHVGHPLGYIASDIYARYKRLKGYNVLHPMGYDSFGLPAEQYAIQTGQHPAITTEANIKRYREQLDNIGFSFDWSREVRTSEADYYKWTQWIFMQLFNHYFDKKAGKALKISDLVSVFEKEGNHNVVAVCDDDTPSVSAAEWHAMDETAQQLFLLKYRLTFPEESFVNWCPALGTVLSNDEIKDGVSERGGYPVERKLMKQWSMRITAYADRLLEGLDTVEWSESLKEQQRNWIGRSQGASVKFPLADNPAQKIEVFTTRVDTIFGVSFMVLAPEHELVAQITTEAQREAIESYQKWAASRSEVERQSEAKKVTGAFTGAYCINPFNDEKVPIYIADYVLAGYGTGAVMAVPSGDQRDWNFAKHFDLPIIPILDAQKDTDTAADSTKEGRYINSGFINGMTYTEATAALVAWLEERDLGKGKIQYRLRNAVFSRQRYWGEPVPAYWKNGVPYLIEESELPLVLPKIDKYLPTETGEPPLGRAENWKYKGEYEYELSTMPGWAGSSWYFYRYMDAQNDKEFASKEAVDYWQSVDLYLGGTEHAVGHLLYSRFWNHFLFDLGLVPQREYAKKLVNQGMIQGIIENIYMWKNTNQRNGIEAQVEYQGVMRGNIFYCKDFVRNNLDIKDFVTEIPINIEFVKNYSSADSSYLDAESIRQLSKWRSDFEKALFITNEGSFDAQSGKFYAKDGTEISVENFKFLTKSETGKMSKSKHNVINPDDVVAEHGADCFRMFEMFLGPIEQAKPWSTTSISGVSGFLRKLWSLFYDLNTGKYLVTDEEPTKEEYKILHTCIKKVNDDLERFSFNTCISGFMVCVNELKAGKCHKRLILNDLVVMLAPFAPFVTEELWEVLGNTPSVTQAKFPELNEAYLATDAFMYPISINGKRRGEIALPSSMTKEEIEAQVPSLEIVQKWLGDGSIKKIIVVPARMINVVI